MTIRSHQGGAFRVRSRSEINARVAKLLLDGDHVDKDRLEELRHRATWLEVPLEQAALEEGVVDQPRLLDMLARITGVPVFNMATMPIEEQALATISAKTVTEFNIVPVCVKNGVVTVATDHVWEVTDEDHLRVMLGYEIAWVFCTTREINEYIKHYYGVGIKSFLKMQN